jgi:hypothetical protein
LAEDVQADHGRKQIMTSDRHIMAEDRQIMEENISMRQTTHVHAIFHYII